MNARQNSPEITIPIHEIGAGGDGIGTYEGKPVYVPKTAPGDVARLRLDELSAGSYKAKLIAVETPSSDRQQPPCPYFQKCGGCSLQHVNEKFYHAWKIEKIKTTLERAGVKYETWEEPIFLPAATRRRTSLNVRCSGKNIQMGYNEERTHNIIDIKKCLILESALDEKIQALRPYLLEILPDDKACDITLQHADGAYDMVLTGPFVFEYVQHAALAEMAEKLDIARITTREKDFKTPEILLERKNVLKKFGNLVVNLPPATFLQASTQGESTLTALVTKHAQGSQNIADLFSGCGTFIGALNTHVTAIDGDAPAIAALTKAAAAHKNINVLRRDLFKNPLTKTELNKFDCVILDPPRAGAQAQSTELAASDVPKIIGVSCNPATFARDAKILQDGGYALKSLTLVDQFVYSAHAELVALFTK